MPHTPSIRVRTRDLDQAIEEVARVYCPHSVDVLGRARGIQAALDVIHPGDQPLVRLSYSTPVAIDAGSFPRLYLMMNCSRGAAAARQGSRRIEWRRGETVPLSAGLGTDLGFDTEFEQTTVRLDIDRLEALCARWLGRPLEQALHFALRPFSPPLEDAWQRAVQLRWRPGVNGLPLATIASASLDEFMLALLLHHHPHNYSEELAGNVVTPLPRVIRRAERYMSENAGAPITVSDIAAEAGVSVRALQAGFRDWRQTSPTALLRRIRLQHVREELLQPQPSTSVTQVALRWGFSHLGRFSALYRAAFGESPAVTLRRRRGSGAR
jgi:AraC-like DNA-binding protein